MPNKQVTVLAGLPGSGKSHIRNDVKYINAYHYSTDDNIEVAAAKQFKTYNDVFFDAIKEAATVSNSEVMSAIANGQSVIWDQTNLSVKKRKSILSRFDKSYKKVCICIMPPETYNERADIGSRLNARIGKSIPSHIMKSMENNYVLPTLAEGFDEVHFIDMYGKQLCSAPQH